MTRHVFVTDPEQLAKGCGSCASPEGIALIDCQDEGPPLCLTCYRELVGLVAVEDEHLVEVKRDLRIGGAPLPPWSKTPVPMAEVETMAKLLGPGSAIWVTPQTGKVEVTQNLATPIPPPR